jgi:hypothetical protein
MSHPSDPRDSMPPLAATGATMASGTETRARTVGGSVLPLVLVLGLAGAFEARAALTPPPHRTAALDGQSQTPLEPPPPVNEREDDEPSTLEAQRQRLFARMQAELGVSSAALADVRAIFAASPYLGQGNPAVSQHPMSRSECQRIRADAGIESARVEACGAPNMVPLFDAEASETANDARVCIDQLEFPDIPCEYPVVNVRANEAADLCHAMGKRLCDAHEWEGACAGSLRPADREYRWGWPRLAASYAHNVKREKVWAYGPTKDHALCATGSFITEGCTGGGWRTCGSNTYPAGAFPACQSPFGVFDLHGNAAEHMSLPLRPEQLGRRGGEGFTEMKGSWFAFATVEAHADDCRYRAPAWHETRLDNTNSHRNYHLGFRCCKDVAGR